MRLLSFHEWVRHLPGSGKLPSRRSAEELEAIAARVERWQEIRRERGEAEGEQEYEQWLADNELSEEPPQDARGAQVYARKICDRMEYERIPLLKRQAEHLEGRTAGAGAEGVSDRSRLARVRQELAHCDRLVDELWSLAWPAEVNPVRHPGDKDAEGFPLLSCHRCKKVGAFESEHAKFVAGRRGCEDCQKGDREHQAEVTRRAKNPTWVDQLKTEIGGTE
ncbi:MAG: hypothetical protein ACRDG7_19580 [Candidatus Limnocylindria bacterium]